jgi:hypothetical protein
MEFPDVPNKSGAGLLSGDEGETAARTGEVGAYEWAFGCARPVVALDVPKTRMRRS